MLDRSELESQEAAKLAPYAMRSAESRGRKYPEKPPSCRTAYQRDRDRIIHSTAFRRLEYKTQVFANHEGDHYRTRLTHTMEVAQIARTIARALGANEDLVESIALAHDLGHTPFGHSGENALKEMMTGEGGFEHNLHGLRVVDHLERQYPAFPGLNLSFEVREAIAKHSTAYDSPELNEQAPEFMRQLFHEFRQEQPPTLEAQIVEIADSIAYDSHDIDDGLYSGYLNERELTKQRLPGLAIELAEKESAAAENEAYPLSEEEKPRRRQLVRHLINIVVIDFIEETSKRLNDAAPRSSEDVRNLNERITAFSDEVKRDKEELEQYLMANFYRHYRVLRMARKAQRFIIEIFGAYDDDPRQLPPEFQGRVAVEGKRRAICDYIAGMTDRFAQQEYLRLFMPFESA